MQYIVPHNPDWKVRFERTAASIAGSLPPGCRIHHVGSTCIPGMPAKDVIDIDIECPAGSMSAVIGALARLGYEHEGDKGITGREAFRAAPGSQAAEQPDHHLYACESGASELRRHLAFRDYLKSHPDRAQWLAEQKVAVDRDAASRSQYIENKAPFYQVIVEESLEWAKQKAIVDKDVSRVGRR